MSNPSEPTPMPRATLCPYCGQLSRDPKRCDRCRGHFDHLSRQASQNAMGPWFVRDEANPFRPGCSLETIQRLVARGRLTPESVIRGPSTRQFWTLAKRTPGIANLFGVCHSCQARTAPDARECASCGATFDVSDDRQQLGLGPVRLLPGHADAESVAHHASAASARAPGAGRAIGTILLVVASLAALAIGGAALVRSGAVGGTTYRSSSSFEAGSPDAPTPTLGDRPSEIVSLDPAPSAEPAPDRSVPEPADEPVRIADMEPRTEHERVETARDPETDRRRAALLGLRGLP